VLSLAGAALGLIVAYWASGFLTGMMWERVSCRWHSMRDRIGGCWVFTILVSLLTAVIFGVAPAWQLYRAGAGWSTASKQPFGDPRRESPGQIVDQRASGVVAGAGRRSGTVFCEASIDCVRTTWDFVRKA